MFRECVLAVFGGGQKSRPEDAYCRACRDLGDDDCNSCDRTIEVIDV